MKKNTLLKSRLYSKASLPYGRPKPKRLWSEPVGSGADFTNFLLKNNYSNSTIHQTLLDTQDFIGHCKKTEVDVLGVTFQTVLSFIEAARQRGVKPQSINNQLNNIKKYYGYLLHHGYIKTNPINRIAQKGTSKSILTHPFTPAQLQAIYKHYAKQKTYLKPTSSQAHLRNKVILGLMIYQGLHTGELRTLQIQDIDMNNASLCIQAQKRSNQRYIQLQATQIVDLHNYLETIHSHPSTTSLFTGNITNLVFHIINELKGTFTHLQNAGHIRASVIQNWLSQHGKRQTQYLIGHRYISSTEKYQTTNVQTLTNLMKSFHPFG